MGRGEDVEAEHPGLGARDRRTIRGVCRAAVQRENGLHLIFGLPLAGMFAPARGGYQAPRRLPRRATNPDAQLWVRGERRGALPGAEPEPSPGWPRRPAI
jgi:hypothetical protein